ncbi:MAG: hypothetical protein U0Q18_05285 [Bryobacteraceae bacterium]
MPEDVFRWVITAAVCLAAIAMIVQAVVVAALYRAGKQAVKSGQEAQSKIGPMVDRLEVILKVSSQILEENHPRVNQMSQDISALVKTARAEFDRLTELVNDASDRARKRIAQLDQTVDTTVGEVEHVSEAVKGAMLKPVKEMNGLVAGLKAALATYAQGGTRPPVDHITQDEEMFI